MSWSTSTGVRRNTPSDYVLRVVVTIFLPKGILGSILERLKWKKA